MKLIDGERAREKESTGVRGEKRKTLQAKKITQKKKPSEAVSLNTTLTA